MPRQDTKHLTAIPRFVPGSSRGSRSSDTFRQQMAKAMEAAQAAEVAQRIRDLRDRTPQPVIADRVGISLRAAPGGRRATG